MRESGGRRPGKSPVSFPARAVGVVSLLPVSAMVLMLFGLSRLHAAGDAYGTVGAIVSIAVSAAAVELAAFPANVRGLLEHRFALARTEGTSWLPEMREAGRCALVVIDRQCADAARRVNHALASFEMFAALHAIAGAAISIGAVTGWFPWTAAIWACGIAVGACAAFVLLALNYRRAAPVGPDEHKITEAAKLHLRCDQERRVELMALVKKG